MVTNQLAEGRGVLVGSIYQFLGYKCSHHDDGITKCVAGPELHSSGNQVTAKEVEATRQTDRWTDGARLVCCGMLTPSLSTVPLRPPGLVSP